MGIIFLVIVVGGLACYGLAGLISLLGVDINIVFYFTIAFVVGGFLIIGGLVSKDIIEISEKTNERLIKIAKIVVPILAVAGLVFAFIDGSKESPSSNTGNWTKEKGAECRSRSNTYYKCSWSSWEDRCVCKQR